MVKYFNANEKLVTSMICGNKFVRLAIANNGTILFKEESGSGNKVDK